MADFSTGNNPSDLLSEHYVLELLSTLEKSKVVVPLGIPSINIPRGKGKLAKWLRYDEFNCTTPADFEISEGTNPSPSTITTRNVTATVKEYGTYVTVTDWAEYMSVDPVIENISKRLGEHAGQLLEVLTISELDSNLPNQFANGKASLATTGVGDVLTAKEFLKATVTLKKNSVKAHESGSFVCVIHPACEGDVKNDTNVGGWVDVNKYNGSVDKILNGELGKLYGTKILSSELISSTTSGTLSSATVYSNLFVGQECFGIVTLNSKNIEMIRKGNTEGGPSNPLNLYGTVGYKIMGFVPKYLGGSSNGTADRGLRIRSGSAF